MPIVSVILISINGYINNNSNSSAARLPVLGSLDRALARSQRELGDCGCTGCGGLRVYGSVRLQGWECSVLGR